MKTRQHKVLGVLGVLAVRFQPGHEDTKRLSVASRLCGDVRMLLVWGAIALPGCPAGCLAALRAAFPKEEK